MSGKIFINYRRELSQADALHLSTILIRRFGKSRIFIDTHGIDGFSDWLNVLKQQVAGTAAMIAVIGPGWLDLTDDQGNRRLDNSQDFVRFEIAEALSRDIPVLPVLLDGAEMPKRERLPEDMRGMLRRQAMHLQARRFEEDAADIARALRKILKRRRVVPLWAAVGLAIAALGGGIYAGPDILRQADQHFPWLKLAPPSGPETLEREVDRLRQALAEAEQAARSARGDLQAAWRQIAALEREQAQLQRQRSEAIAARDKARSRANAAEAARAKAQQAADDAKSRMRRLARRTASLLGKTLTIVSWGGAYAESQLHAYHEPYTDKTGIKIYNEDKSANALAGIRAQVAAGNVSWDIVDMLQADAQRACDEGLIMEVDHNEWLANAPDGTEPTNDFIEGTLGDCFVPNILYSTIFAYNTNAFPNGGPQTVEDIWNLEKFPGPRALQKIPQKNLEWALIADGVDLDKVYEVLATREGQNRAFAKLDEIKDKVIWWMGGAQPSRMLADKEAVIVTAYNGRIFNAQVNEDQPFKIMWDRQMFEADGWVVPIGNEDDLELIKDYLYFATDTQRLADQARYIAYAPARNSSVPLVNPHADTGVDMKLHIPTSPENFKTAFRFDPDFWADYSNLLEERFNAWVAQ